MEPLADVAVVVRTGPEVVAGSTRMKAGTAQKMVLNMVSTAAMVRLGKVYRNLMVDVRPLNRKLAARAARIVAEAAGVSVEEAEDLLERAGRNAKAAIVMARTGCTLEEALERLERASGHVRAALGEP
jgi:N-acetylmuramic acid 6-phosphate etherase